MRLLLNLQASEKTLSDAPASGRVSDNRLLSDAMISEASLSLEKRVELLNQNLPCTLDFLIYSGLRENVRFQSADPKPARVA